MANAQVPTGPTVQSIWPRATPALGNPDQRVYAYLLGIQTMLVLAFQLATLLFGQLHVNLMSLQPLRTIICHFVFIVPAQLAQFSLSLEAMWRRDPVQIGWTAMLQVFFLIVSACQIFETRDSISSALCDNHSSGCAPFQHWWGTLRPIQITTTVVYGVVLPIQLLIAIILGHHIGWELYPGNAPVEFISYQTGLYKFCTLLTKFAFLLIVTTTGQLLVLARGHGMVTEALSIAALGLSLVFLIGSLVTARYEIQWLRWSMQGLAALLQCYITWRFVDLYHPATRHLYYNTRITLSLEMVVVSVLLVMSVIYSSRMIFGDTDIMRSKTKDPDLQTRRNWRVGLDRLPHTSHPHTEPSYEYYAEAEEMCERGSIK